MKDAIAFGIPSAITTSNTHQVIALPPKYISLIDPFDTMSFSVDTKESKYQWDLAPKMISYGLPMAITMANAEWILDLFKDWSTQYGLDHITKVPTSGTGSNDRWR